MITPPQAFPKGEGKGALLGGAAVPGQPIRGRMPLEPGSAGYPLLQRALATLPSGTVVVGASGGGDSQSLLVALAIFRPDIHVIALYCNHGLRDLDAIAHDQTVVRAVCQEWGGTFRVRRIPVRPYATRYHVGIEEAGRWWRYRVLGHIARLHQAVAILTAHHLDDAAETALLQLIRGTRTFSSLGGRPASMVSRPFRLIPQSYLESFQEALGFPYSTDLTNFDSSFTRSKLRHKVMPTLKEINPRVTQHILAFSDYLDQLHQGIDDHFPLHQWVYIAKNWVQIHQDYWGLHDGIRSHLNRMLCHKLGILESFIPQFDQCHSQLGTRKWVQGWSITVTPTHVYLLQPVPLPPPWTLPLRVGEKGVFGPFLIQVHDPSYPTSESAVLVDRSYFPHMQVAPRSNGLYYHPVGYDTPIRLKSFLVNQSVFPPIRHALPLFFSGDELVWVPYVRRSVLLSCVSTTPDWVVVSVSYLDSSSSFPNPAWQGVEPNPFSQPAPPPP